jgi:NTE family protein
MVFHIGALWRLYEAGLLGKITRISSVSGGSIAAGLLGLKWRELTFEPANLKSDFVPNVVEPLRGLAGETIDEEAFILGHVLPGSVSDRIAGLMNGTSSKAQRCRTCRTSPASSSTRPTSSRRRCGAS